ncbi:ABC transporter ATP-binding protein [bacterium]|nr:MAG: ABC transporter ATP-binding protein [bacterium]
MNTKKMSDLIRINHLRTYLNSGDMCFKAVDDISFDIHSGETLCLVGESGCGKSVTALSILRLLAEPPWEVSAEELWFKEKNMLSLSAETMRAIRGNDIAMIFQEPMTSLNPVFTVGNQIHEALILHKKISQKEAKALTIKLMKKVGLPDAENKYDDYPHQLSGGMRQRVMIAMALSCDPSLLIADEPTTALDVTVQAQILELLRAYQQESGMGLLLITHDFGVVAEMADRVAVMYASKIVESGDVQTIFRNPKHPYTIGLLDAIPKIDSKAAYLKVIPGQVPDSSRYPQGCHFAPRCEYAVERCRNEKPDSLEIESGHFVNCWEFERVFRQNQKV